MKQLASIVSLFVIGSCFFASVAYAQVDAANVIKNLTPTLAQPIGGFGAPGDFGPASESSNPWLGNYIRALFIYGVSIAAVLALLMVMVGGFLWLTAGGRSDQVGRAKDYISSALLGLALALVSYMLLYTINPRVVALDPIKIPEPRLVAPSE